MTTGLYIGKLAPMHLGHELIIRRMIGECDRAVVLIYNSDEFQAENPRLTKVLRGYWLEKAYPELDVVLGFNPPPDTAGLDGDIVHAKYVQSLMPCPINRVYGAEAWVDVFADVMGAMSCRVERDGQGISATKVRQNPAKYAWYMRPEIRDWMLTNYGTTEDMVI